MFIQGIMNDIRVLKPKLVSELTGGPLKTSITGLHLSFWFHRSYMGLEKSAFLTSPQVKPLPLVQGPHLENSETSSSLPQTHCCHWLVLLANLCTGARQAPLSMGFTKQEYWSGLPFPFPWDLPDQGIRTRDQAWVSCLTGGFFMSEPPGKLPKTHYEFWFAGVRDIGSLYYCKKTKHKRNASNSLKMV